MKHLVRLMQWALMVMVLLSSAFAADAGEGAQTQEHMVPMRDGVKLATTVYLPDGTGPWPVIVSRTPYNKAGFVRGHVRYTRAGYAFVGQDVRGQFASEGDYIPFSTAREDGYDTIAWVNERPFCDGNIGMSGASALGITTNMAASANPPGLKAGYAVVAPQSAFNQATFINGVFKWAQVGGWMEGQGAGDQVAPMRATPVMSDRWRKRDFVHYIDRVNIPMYNVGGWYDIFLQGNIDNFKYLQEKGRRGARGKQKLLMGPIGHGELSGDLAYPESFAAELANEEIRWFDYWLKGAKNGIMDEPAVNYYMMASARKGAPSSKNTWMTSDAWPPEHTQTRLYLADEFGLSWNTPMAGESATEYKFDPHQPVPTFGGSNLRIEKGPMDQRAVGQRADYLRFQTPPLKTDVAIAGPVSMELWASTNGPDTDFMIKLIDVYPDGYEALVLDNPIRARFRNGRNPEDVAMMEPGQPEKLVIDMWSTAITFEQGHRIAIHVTSSNYPRFDVNPNTGVPTMKPRAAMNTVYYETDHPSAIVLPVVTE